MISPKALTTRIRIALALRLWAQLADFAGDGRPDLATMRGLRGSARALRRQVDRVIHTAEGRLALPAREASRLPSLLGSDWTWRPEPWCGPLSLAGKAALGASTRIAEGISLFHDCPLAEIGYRQVQNRLPGDGAAFGLAIETYGFRGSFLSLVIDLPPEVANGLRKKHVIRLDTSLEADIPAGIMVRLNIRHGPNVEQLIGTIPATRQEGAVEFDLAYAGIDEQRIEKLWVDLFIQSPAMNAVTLRDIAFHRRPRADL
jgi:hypothetical protein